MYCLAPWSTIYFGWNKIVFWIWKIYFLKRCCLPHIFSIYLKYILSRKKYLAFTNYNLLIKDPFHNPKLLADHIIVTDLIICFSNTCLLWIKHCTVFIYLGGWVGLVQDLFVEEQTFKKGEKVLPYLRPLQK